MTVFILYLFFSDLTFESQVFILKDLLPFSFNIYCHCIIIHLKAGILFLLFFSHFCFLNVSTLLPQCPTIKSNLSHHKSWTKCVGLATHLAQFVSHTRIVHRQRSTHGAAAAHREVAELLCQGSHH